MPRTRALALASAYVAGIAVMFGALGTIFGLTGSKFGAYLGNPWVIVPLALFFVAMGLSMFGAFEMALPSGLQERLSRVGGRGFLGAFMMGLVGGIIAAPCTGPPLAGAARLRDHDARRGLGVRRCSRPTAPASACRSGCWRRFSMSLPRPGALDGLGEELVWHRASSPPRSTTSRTWSRRWPTSPRRRRGSRS